MNFWSGLDSTGVEAPPRRAAGSVGRVVRPKTGRFMNVDDIGSLDLLRPDEVFDRSAMSLASMEERSTGRRYQATAGKYYYYYYYY